MLYLLPRYLVPFTLAQPLPFYSHYTSQPVLAGTSGYELEDFVGAKFYCPHAIADGNQHIRIRRKRWSSQQCYLHCLRTFYTSDVTLMPSLCMSHDIAVQWIFCVFFCGGNTNGRNTAHVL